MNDKRIEKKVEGKKKRGRRSKNEIYVYELNKEQVKYFVDLGKDKKDLANVQSLLVKTNDKDHGAEITFKDLAVYGISKLGQKDIEKLQDNSLTEMEKVNRALIEFNLKNSTKLELGEFLIKKLNLN
jgi:hypothetical protein